MKELVDIVGFVNLLVLGHVIALLVGLFSGYFLFNQNDKEYRRGYTEGFKASQKSVSQQNSKPQTKQSTNKKSIKKQISQQMEK